MLEELWIEENYSYSVVLGSKIFNFDLPKTRRFLGDIVYLPPDKFTTFNLGADISFGYPEVAVNVQINSSISETIKQISSECNRFEAIYEIEPSSKERYNFIHIVIDNSNTRYILPGIIILL